MNIEYIVTVKIYNDFQPIQHLNVLIKMKNIDGDGFMKILDNCIKLPPNATHYEIQGIYKL